MVLSPLSCSPILRPLKAKVSLSHPSFSCPGYTKTQVEKKRGRTGAQHNRSASGITIKEVRIKSDNSLQYHTRNRTRQTIIVAIRISQQCLLSSTRRITSSTTFHCMAYAVRSSVVKQRLELNCANPPPVFWPICCQDIHHSAVSS